METLVRVIGKLEKSMLNWSCEKGSGVAGRGNVGVVGRGNVGVAWCNWAWHKQMFRVKLCNCQTESGFIFSH